MRRMCDAFLSALAYFTVFPVGVRAAPQAQTLVWLAPTGALVGATAGAAAWLIALVAPHAFAVATAFALCIVLTGAIHIDGFLDSCDGLFASVTPQRRLEILKDPLHGTFAVAGFAVIVIFWLVSLWLLPVTQLAAVLAFSAALARWSAVLNVFIIPDARAGEGTRIFTAKPSWLAIVLESVFLATAAVMLGKSAVAFCACAPVLSLLVGQWAKHRLGGGLTGDIYGFLIVVLEIAALGVLAAPHGV
jgi:adenosylcobinamide-GDP ribazoletransferase